MARLREHVSSSSNARQWINWILVLILQILVATGYWMLLPSMHQFITNPKQSNTPHDEVCLVRPGLGESEYIYSWIVTAYAIGEVVGATTSGLMTTILPYYIIFPTVCVIHIIGGVLYATTINSIMFFTARFLMGVFAGAVQALLSGYLGESADRFDAKEFMNDNALLKEQKHNCLEKCFDNKNGKRTRKDFLFVVYAFVRTFGSLLVLGFASVLAQFPEIHQFRWPGWFVAVATAIYTVVFLIAFSEKPKLCNHSKTKQNDTHDEDSSDHDKLITSEEPIKESWQHGCCTVKNFKKSLAYIFLILTGYVAGSLYNVMDTLLNPILSDQFGFTVADISYFVLVVSALPVLGAIFLATIKIIAIDNRKALAGLLFIAAVGTVILSDWQAIGKDHCSLFCKNETLTNLSNNTNHSTSDSTLSLTDWDTCNGNSKVQTLSSFLNLSVSDFEDLCENTSTSKYTCHWNPRSRITGKYCSECSQRCVSTEKSLYFLQLCVSIATMIFILPMVSIVVNVVASDYTPTEYQGVIMGAILTASAVSRIISPVWSDWVYEVTSKHTYVIMTIHSSTLAFVLILLLLLYKQLAPKSLKRTNFVSRNGYVKVSNKEDKNDNELKSHSSDSDDSEVD